MKKYLFYSYVLVLCKYVVEARECNLCKTAIPIIPTVVRSTLIIE